MRGVLAGSQRALGARDPSTLRHAANVAWLLQRTGDEGGAVDAYRETLEGLRGVKTSARDARYVDLIPRNFQDTAVPL